MQFNEIHWTPPGEVQTNNVFTFQHNTVDITVLVEGFGSAQGHFMVRGSHDSGHIAEALGIPLPENEWLPMTVLGRAAVYAEPLTFAWLIHDLIRNG